LLLSVLGGKLHSLLFLSLIAEPDAHDVLFQIELFGNGGDLLARWPRLDGEVGFQRALLRSCYGCPFS